MPLIVEAATTPGVRADQCQVSSHRRRGGCSRAESRSSARRSGCRCPCPTGRPIFSRRCMMMNTAFATTASVIAICSADQDRAGLVAEHGAQDGTKFHELQTPVVLRHCVFRYGGRLDAADAPGRIQAREQTRRAGRCRAPSAPIVKSSRVTALVVLVELAHAEQPSAASADAEQPAADADHADLHEVLAEDQLRLAPSARCRPTTAPRRRTSRAAGPIMLSRHTARNMKDSADQHAVVVLAPLR